jgi:phosphohistidine phosphatase
MRIHLCRHAEAAPGSPDELRTLTPAGIAAAEALAARLAASHDPPALVVTSPLLRARQTAEIVATALGVRLLVDARLAPGATSELLRAALTGVEGPVATVGHQPDCSEIVEALTAESPPFPPAGSVELELEVT